MFSKRIIFFSLCTFSILKADTYTLYLASTPNINDAKTIYSKINSIMPNENLIIRTHEKGDYSVIIRYLKSEKEALNIKKSLSTKNLFRDSYFRKFKEEPFYNIVNPISGEKTTNLANNITTTTKKEKIKTVQQEFIKNEEFKEFKESKRKINKNSYNHKIESSNEYLTATTLYNLGRYEDSYKLFKAIFKKNNYNVNVNYFLAQNAIRLKKLDEASAALERVLIQKPNFNKARYDYAKVLYLLKLKNESKKEFETLLKANINSQTKEKIKQYLKNMDNEPKYASVTANILIGVNHSSNVNKGFGEVTLPNSSKLSDQEKSDFGHSEIVDLSFINSIGNSPFKVKNSLLGFNQNYFNESDENFSVFGYKPALIFFNSSNQDIYGLNFGVNRINRKNNESFNTFNISPEYINKDFLFSFNYQKTAYIEDSYTGADYDKYEFLFKYNLLQTLKIYTKISKYLSEEKNDFSVDRTSYETGFEYFYTINNKNMVKLEYSFIQGKYKYENTNLGSKRKDDEQSVKLSYIYKYNNFNQFILSSGYTKNNSNQEVYYYDEFENKINYIKTFTW